MNKTNEDLAIQILSEQIRKVASKLIDDASYDKTVAGIVTATLGNHRYKVKIKNEEYTLPSSTDQTYKVNEAVWVCIPQNNMKNKFISGRRRS
jgi:hypothetical protein